MESLRQSPMRILPVCLALASATAAADAIDDYVAGVMAADDIPGLAVLVVRDGQVTKMQGYGEANIEHGVPVTADTIFQSGSVGKQFTAAAVLLLAERGRLELDAPLAKYFPEGPAAWHEITIRHLLTHTSGMKDYDDEFDYRRDYTEAELLDVAMGLPITFEPGTQWSYSNSGYMVLGVLLSRLVGEHWSGFARDNVFLPAGMQTTDVITEAGIVPHRAAGYERGDDGELVNQAWVAPPFNTQADGALYFSLRDLAAWDRTLRERRLLSDQSYAAWWSPVQLAGGHTYPYGFGWEITDQRGRRLIEHGGSWQGFRTQIARYVDDKVTVAVLANVSDADPRLIAHEIAGLVDPDLALPSPSAGRDGPPALMAKLRGILEAWGSWTESPDMAAALAGTRTGSAREASARNTVAAQLDAATRFAWLAEDEVAAGALGRRGGAVRRIVYCVLETDDTNHRYRFYLTAGGRVLDFEEI